MPPQRRRLLPSGVLKTLARFPWEDIEVDGSLCDEQSGCDKSCRTTWDDTYPQTILFACATSIKRLVVTGCNFQQEDIVEDFLQGLPKLEALTLGGVVVGGHDALYESYVKHERLASLNIASLVCPDLGVFLAPVNQLVVVPDGAFLVANLPSLRKLSATMFQGMEDGDYLTPLMVDSPHFSFPSSLEVLELYWRGFSYFDFATASLFAMLEKLCPQLEELHVRLSDPESEDAK